MTADQKRMSFGEHLEELRTAVLRSLIAIAVGFLFCFLLLREPLMAFVIRPHEDVVAWAEGRAKEQGKEPPVRHLQALSPQERIVSYIKVSALAGFLIASPIVFWLLWSFVAAGLYEHERRLVRFVAPFSAALFLAGAAFAYLVLLPYGLRFLYHYGLQPIDTGIRLNFYLGFFTNMVLLMGIVFQIPLVSLALQAMGLFTTELLRRYRRHALLVMCLVAAAFTPPDWITLLVVVGPMALLYELGIWIGRIARVRRNAAGSGGTSG